jgi:hypothetical protein
MTNPQQPPGWYPGPPGVSAPLYLESAAPQVLSKQKNTLGLIALIVAIIGFIFACIPGALIVGWVLLPIAFVLGVVGLLPSGKAKATSVAAVIISIVGTVVGVSVFAVVAGDAFSNAFRKSDLSPSTQTAISGGGGASQPNSRAAPQPNSKGSRDNPLPIGETVSNQDWQVVLGVPREAWADIAATNQFNHPPKPGMEYWIVPITATYTGNQTGNPTFGITVKFVGSDNRTYDEYCGVIPDPVNDVGDLYKGGVAKGNKCVAVPAGANGLWTVSTGFGGKPVFFVTK